MITLEYTRDDAAILAIAGIPDVWQFVSDDIGGDFEKYELPKSPGIHYYLVKENNHVVGFVLFISVSSLALEMHAALIPSFRGNKSEQVLAAIKAAINQDMPQMKRLRVFISAWNKPAVSAAIRCGLDFMGTEPSGSFKDGRYHNLLLFGASL